MRGLKSGGRHKSRTAAGHDGDGDDGGGVGGNGDINIVDIEADEDADGGNDAATDAGGVIDDNESLCNMLERYAV